MRGGRQAKYSEGLEGTAKKGIKGGKEKKREIGVVKVMYWENYFPTESLS